MPVPEQNQDSDFMIEKIKERPLNKKKLLRRTLTTASMAVIFGLIACLTFLILEPVFNNWLYPEAKPEQVEVKLNLNCWDQRLRANELQLSQMLLNLTLNSFQAMPEGGTLTIDTWFDEDTLFLRVADTGCGIPEADLPHIFEPFFTTKKAGAGTGLGLAIAAQVAEDHHGTIAASSQVGSGTTFTVALPRFFSPDQQNSTKS